MLYSVVPIEYVYSEQLPNDHLISYVYNGVLMEVKPLTTGQALIVRLINPPLDNFLDPNYAPGCLIPYMPT